MKPTPKKIQAELKRLRAICETKLHGSKDDQLLSRLAQVSEYAIQWATVETVGWMKPHKDIELIAKIIRQEQNEL